MKRVLCSALAVSMAWMAAAAERRISVDEYRDRTRSGSRFTAEKSEPKPQPVNPDAIDLVPIPRPVEMTPVGAPPLYDSLFARALRFVGHDMHISDKRDTGIYDEEIPELWWPAW